MYWCYSRLSLYITVVFHVQVVNPCLLDPHHFAKKYSPTNTVTILGPKLLFPVFVHLISGLPWQSKFGANWKSRWIFLYLLFSETGNVSYKNPSLDISLTQGHGNAIFKIVWKLISFLSSTPTKSYLKIY